VSLSTVSRVFPLESNTWAYKKGPKMLNISSSCHMPFYYCPNDPSTPLNKGIKILRESEVKSSKERFRVDLGWTYGA
jgi:hypothetical protein